MKVKELTGWLDGRYPSSAAEHWDNVGLLVGDDEEEVSHVFLALDLTESTLAQAIDAGADMIITHHPMILFILGVILVLAPPNCFCQSGGSRNSSGLGSPATR